MYMYNLSTPFSIHFKVLIGHNEDWIASMENKDCLMMAHILPYTAADGRTFPEERFVVHTWPGKVHGTHMAR